MIRKILLHNVKKRNKTSLMLLWLVMMNNSIHTKLSGEPEVHSSARSYFTMLKRNHAYLKLIYMIESPPVSDDREAVAGHVLDTHCRCDMV